MSANIMTKVAVYPTRTVCTMFVIHSGSAQNCAPLQITSFLHYDACIIQRGVKKCAKMLMQQNLNDPPLHEALWESGRQYFVRNSTHKHP